MTLADKIIELRKKKGWSQEELAEKLDVSRQSVSKWESGQSLPDMNRIIALSDLFGVSVDTLVRDEPRASEEEPRAEESEKPLRTVPMKEAQDFLLHKRTSSLRIAIGVLLCVLSPICLILFSALQGAGYWAMTEEQAAGMGLLALFFPVGVAVALFVLSGISGKPFEYLTTECIDVEHGVKTYVREERAREQSKLNAQLVAGIVLCVLSSVSIFVAMLMPEGTGVAKDFRYAVASAVLLLFVAVGACFIVLSSIRRGGYSALLEEGDHTRASKKDSSFVETIDSVYWTLITAGYLTYSFITKDWGRSWIVWPIAAMIYAAIRTVILAVHKSKTAKK